MEQTENLRALAAEYYVSEKIFEEELEKLFFKSWQYACHPASSQLRGTT